jgi:uncharacterized membrane protein
MDLLAIAALTFLGMHLLPSTPIRGRAVATLGETGWMALFSVASLVAIWWLVNRFNNAAYGDKIWLASEVWLYVKAALILFAFVLAVAGNTSPNPSVPMGGKLLDRHDIGTGIFAITRHPLMWGIAIWALCHVVTQATPRGIAFFGSLAATALIGAYLQERRKRKELGERWAAFERKTSFLPFVAIAQGRARLSLSDIGWWRLALSVALWAAFLFGHAWLFGPTPVPALA